VSSSNDRHANLETNYLLQRLDSFTGIAVLTTNAGTAIDTAFKRRMSIHVQFPFPDEADRERLWRAHLPETLPIAGPLELAPLARKQPAVGRLHPQRLPARRLPRRVRRRRADRAPPAARGRPRVPARRQARRRPPRVVGNRPAGAARRDGLVTRDR